MAFEMKNTISPHGMWESKAKSVVLESLLKQRQEDRRFSDQVQRELHAFLDQGTTALSLIKDRMRVTHPVISKEWTKENSGVRLFGLIPMMTNTLSTMFHAPPETFLTANGERLPEDHPETIQWREDSRDLPGVLSQLDRWTVLFRTVLLQPAWINGRMKWVLYPPYQISHVEQSLRDPMSVSDADWVTISLPQKWNKPTQYVTWTSNEMFYHDEHGKLLKNPLFVDGLNRYGKIPLSVWRASQPAPGEFFDEPRFGWLNHEYSISLSLADLDHVLKFQSHSQAIVSGWHENAAPAIGPGQAITTHESPAEFKFEWATPNPNIKALMESVENQLRLAAVVEGLPADIWSALGAARTAQAKKMEAHSLTLRRQERLPSYATAMRDTWEIHKLVSNYHWQEGRVRYRPETKLETIFADVQYPRDQFQEAQQNELEFRQGVTSPVDVVMRRESIGREQASERVRSNLMAGKLPADEGGLPTVEYTGVQIQSAITIVTNVQAGQLTRESGVAMLQSFLGITPEQAAQIIGGQIA
jgi:hypothetical protein